MTRAFIRYLLFFCIFLLGCQSILRADISQGDYIHSFVSQEDGTINAQYYFLGNELPVITDPFSSGREKEKHQTQDFLVFENEEENVDSFSFKKYTDKCSCFTEITDFPFLSDYPHGADYRKARIKKSFHLSSNKRYLAIEVFLI